MKKLYLILFFLTIYTSIVYSQMSKLNYETIDSIIVFHRNINIESVNDKYPTSILLMNIIETNDSMIVDILDLNSVFLDMYSRNKIIEYLKLVGLESNYIVLVEKGWEFIDFINECYKIKINSNIKRFKAIFEPLNQLYYVIPEQRKITYLGFRQ